MDDSIILDVLRLGPLLRWWPASQHFMQTTHLPTLHADQLTANNSCKNVTTTYHGSGNSQVLNSAIPLKMYHINHCHTDKSAHLSLALAPLSQPACTSSFLPPCSQPSLCIQP